MAINLELRLPANRISVIRVSRLSYLMFSILLDRYCIRSLIFILYSISTRACIVLCTGMYYLVLVFILTFTFIVILVYACTVVYSDVHHRVSIYPFVSLDIIHLPLDNNTVLARLVAGAIICHYKDVFNRHEGFIKTKHIGAQSKSRQD